MKTPILVLSAIILSAIALSKNSEASVASSGIISSGSKIVNLYLRYKSVIDSECQRLGIPISTAVAVLSVESSGNPYGSDGRLLINFEPKTFAKKVPGEFSFPGGSQSREYEALAEAVAINEYYAYWSTSMGMAQIMGFNHNLVGCSSPKQMFDLFQSSPEEQVRSFFKFCENNKGGVLVKAAATDDFATFAKYYNGPAHKSYDVKMANVKKSFTEKTGIV